MLQFKEYSDIFIITRYFNDYVLERYIGDVQGTLVIPEGVTRIAEGAFEPIWCKDYSKIKKVVFPKTLKCIPSYFCSSWENVEEVVVPEGVTTISDNAFFNTAIKEIVIPSTVNRIGVDVFGLCKNLKTVIINHSTTAIINRLMNNEYNANQVWGDRKEPELAFKLYIGSSKELELSRFFRYYDVYDDKTKFSINDFFVLYGNYVVGYIGKETTLKIPDVAKGIAYEAFSGNKNIRGLVLNEKLRGIGHSAFLDCTNLEFVEFNDGLDQIAASAFENTGIRKVRIPQKVKHVGARAFYNCKKLDKVLVVEKLSGSDYKRPFDWDYKWKDGINVEIDYEYI